MKLTRVAKAGIGLIAAGLSIFVGFAVWAKSIRTTVVDIPMPMKATVVSTDFGVDYDAIYTMSVGFDGSIPLDTARCLLGAEKSETDAPLECKNNASLLKFIWKLSRDGKNGAEGSSSSMGSSWTEDSSRNVSIVSFPAQKKHRYTATYRFGQDAAGLQIPPPRIRIELDVFNREDFIWAGAVFDSLGLLLGVVGAGMLLVPFLRARFKT